MVRQRDSRATSSASANGSRASAARGRLDEAVAELRRLTQGQLFQALERLADVEDVSSASSVNVESVRRLRVWGAEHLRLAAELETAARCCRLIEQELNRQIDATLTGSDHEADALRDHRADVPPLKGHRKSHRKSRGVMGVSGWFRIFARHGHSAHRRTGKEPMKVSAATPYRPSIAPSAQPPLISSSPEADFTALILGPLELSVAGRHVVRWNSLKARAVFQYLLIHRGRPVRRDVLMDLQWPNHTYTSARNNLNVALYSLRNTLEGPWQGLQPILYQDGCYALNSELKWWIDRDEFLSALSKAQLVRSSGHPMEAINRYQKAVELYRGSLFEDDSTGDWYLVEQRHLNEKYLQALESLGEIYLDLGEAASAQEFARLALAKDPCCESVHRLLMRCYASEHKQQLVGRQYSICVKALRDELGVSPGAETLRLFHDLTSISS
jgi:SARP family transcriptional regulator, regulator of embCAB operon